MAAYATVVDLAGPSGYLNQLDETAEKVLLEKILDRATSIIDLFLGASVGSQYFSDWPAASTMNVRTRNDTSFFKIPAHQLGSVTSVTLNSVEVLNWEETEMGMIQRISTGGGRSNWGRGQYVVTAVWGNGPFPKEVEEITLELAVNIWRNRMKGGFSELLGAQGTAAIRFTSMLTREQQAILKNILKQRNKTGWV